MLDKYREKAEGVLTYAKEHPIKAAGIATASFVLYKTLFPNTNWNDDEVSRTRSSPIAN